MVDIKYIRHTQRVISLAELENMPLVRKGNRLSILPSGTISLDWSEVCAQATISIYLYYLISRRNIDCFYTWVLTTLQAVFILELIYLIGGAFQV